MDKKDKLYMINKAISAKKDVDELQSSVEAIFGWSECKFTDTLFKVVDDIIDVVEKSLGDEHHWLSYFMFDCDCGKDPKLVTWKENEEDELTKGVNLSTVEQLLELIEG